MNTIAPITPQPLVDPQDDPFDPSTLQPGEAILLDEYTFADGSTVRRSESHRFYDPSLRFPQVPQHTPNATPVATAIPSTAQLEQPMQAADVTFKDLSRTEALVYGEAIAARCQLHNMSLQDYIDTCGAMLDHPYTGLLHARYDGPCRTKALTIALEVYGMTLIKPAEEQIREGRSMPWTRLTSLFGDGALAGLAGYGAISTTLAATKMAASYAAGQAASFKAAAGMGAKMKVGALATGAALGAATLGLAAAGAGVASAVSWYAVIHTYRDVFDNEGARDAYMFHRLRSHGVAPGMAARTCRHLDGTYTSPVTLLQTRLVGLRNN